MTVLRRLILEEKRSVKILLSRLRSISNMKGISSDRKNRLSSLKKWKTNIFLRFDRLVFQVPDNMTAAIYANGNAYIGGDLVKEKTAAKLSSGDQVEIRAADEKTQVLFISSKRLDEPVAWGGPIVMNSKEELNKAFDDLRKGTFIQKTISY